MDPPLTEADSGSPPAAEADPGSALFSSRDAWAWLTTGFAAAVLVAVGWPVLTVLYGVHVVLAMVVVLVHAASLVLAVRWFALGIIGNAVAILATGLLSGAVLQLPWPWPVTTLLLHCFVVLLLALRHAWPVPIIAWATGSVVPLVAVLLLRADGFPSMSVISVQATTAEYRLPSVDATTAREFTSIADSSRRALNEMRGLLTILRGSGDAPLVPQPTLADVPALVEATRRSGTHISFASTPERLDSGATAAAPAAAVVPAVTGLTAYRVVQEALSNAVRHSPGAAIDVRVDVTDDRIVLHVMNGPAPEAASGSPVPSAPGAGLGLAGIRERVAALAGGVEAGPRADGGFFVHAKLPTR